MPWNHILLLYWHFSFLQPASRFSLPYHPLSLVMELETHTSSLSLEHGHKPWQCTFLLCPAGRCLLLPTLYHFFVLLFILSKLFPTISIDLYDLVIFEEKGHIGKVIVAMLMSTNPSLIPGINPYCLWGLAPAATMVRVRLERLATEASCPKQ